jgi:hypothetical protein
MPARALRLCAIIELVRFRTREAGDFNYHDTSRFWVSVVAGIVIPDNRWAAVQTFAAEHQRRWDMPEPKAANMDDPQALAELDARVDTALVPETVDMIVVSCAHDRCLTGALSCSNRDEVGLLDQPVDDPRDLTKRGLTLRGRDDDLRRCSQAPDLDVGHATLAELFLKHAPGRRGVPLG